MSEQNKIHVVQYHRPNARKEHHYIECGPEVASKASELENIGVKISIELIHESRNMYCIQADHTDPSYEEDDITLGIDILANLSLQDALKEVLPVVEKAYARYNEQQKEKAASDLIVC